MGTTKVVIRKTATKKNGNTNGTVRVVKRVNINPPKANVRKSIHVNYVKGS